MRLNLTRARIQSVVQKNPGIHTSQLALLLGVAWNTCQHHVRVLEREGKLTVEKIDGKICLFDRSKGAYNAKAGTAALRCPTNRRLAAYVLQNPGHNQRQLAGSLDMSTTAIHRRLSRFEEAGLMARLQNGRTTLVHATDDLADAFVESGLRTPTVTVSEKEQESPVVTLDEAPKLPAAAFTSEEVAMTA